MKSYKRHQETTIIDQDMGSVFPSRGNQQLKANYDAILRERSIRYPVLYHLIRELGRGRQGVVFLGMRQGARGCLTRHAIKLFDPSIYSSPKKYWTDMGRLASQVSRLHLIRSDNLVSRDIYEECNGIGYIQMAAVDGIDLRYLLDGSHLAIARSQSTDEEWAHFTEVIFRLDEKRIGLQPGIALHIVRKVLRGLEVLHEAGFLHGDIKPTNIMIDRMGSIKLVDFGRAVMVGEHVNILLGSPFYMAPEIHRREPGKPQSDIYSLGLLALEMLRGEDLVESTGMGEPELLEWKMDLLATFEALMPEHVRENEELMTTLRRFIHPEPEERHTSAEEAETGSDSLRVVHQKLALDKKDAEYERELQNYLAKLINPATGVVNPFMALE
ncbi:MAG: serine/threonine protein kinase [Kiritimatiellae bacterium]|nr:serine/threonine protein kinase [Kiritimatiellia bacterium]